MTMFSESVFPTSTFTFSCTKSVNPAASTVTRYIPTGRLGTTKYPSPLLVAVRRTASWALSTVTVALGMTDLFSSATKPVIEALICWPRIGAAGSAIRMALNTIQLIRLGTSTILSVSTRGTGWVCGCDIALISLGLNYVLLIVAGGATDIFLYDPRLLSLTYRFGGSRDPLYIKRPEIRPSESCRTVFELLGCPLLG